MAASDVYLERRRRPVAERGRRGPHVAAAPNELRFREPPTAAPSETVEQWMARTGQRPESLAPDAITGLAPAFNNRRRSHK